MGLIRNCNSLIWKELSRSSAKTSTPDVRNSKTGARTPCGANTHFSPFPPGDGGREGFVPASC